MAFQHSLFPELETKIAIVDLETTGFLQQKGLIVEIGVVGLNLNTGEIKTEFDSLINEPGLNTTHTASPYGWIFQNSSLKYDQVCRAPRLSDIFSDIQAILDRYPTGLTAYNTSFDLPFLRSRSFTFTALPCPMIAATPVVNLPPFPGKSSPKWPTVQETWNYLFGDDTGYVEAHRAADDARHEAKIVYELYKRGNYSLS